MSTDRRPTRLWLLIIVTACCSQLTGCSGGGIDRTAYARRICTGIGTFESALTANSRALSTAVDAASGDPVKIKKAVGVLLTKAVTDSGTLAATIAAVGYPSGHGGRAVAAAISAAAAHAHDVFLAQQRALAAVATTDKETFTTSLGSISTQVQSAGDMLVSGINSVGAMGDQKLNDAFSHENACSNL